MEQTADASTAGGDVAMAERDGAVDQDAAEGDLGRAGSVLNPLDVLDVIPDDLDDIDEFVVDLDPVTLADEAINADLIVAALADDVEITFHAEDSGPLDED